MHFRMEIPLNGFYVRLRDLHYNQFGPFGSENNQLYHWTNGSSLIHEMKIPTLNGGRDIHIFKIQHHTVARVKEGIVVIDDKEGLIKTLGLDKPE